MCSARRKATNPLPGDGGLSGALRLPYELTMAQRRVVEEIRGDMAQSRPMLRLLQGDVGSGKTVVALLAMLNAVEAGAQAALMAPTEILARQHFATIEPFCRDLGVEVALLTGRQKSRERDAVLARIADRVHARNPHAQIVTAVRGRIDPALVLDVARPDDVLEVDGQLALEPARRPITVHDLLRHTSGLTYEFTGESAVQRLYQQARLGERRRTNAQASVALAALPLACQPGARWE